MAETSSLVLTNADGGMLWDFWYPALRSHQVRGRDLRRAVLLDVPLVIGRDARGKPFALRLSNQRTTGSGQFPVSPS